MYLPQGLSCFGYRTFILDARDVDGVVIMGYGFQHMPHNPSGFEDEIAEIIRLFESSRLVTLLNDDEMLALAVGGKLSEHFADGVWLVPLEAVKEPGDVLRATASVFEVHQGATRPLTVSLIESLREKRLLLLLAHCGHLAGACAQLADTILQTCTEVYILATSQRPLNIAEEKCYPAKNRQPDD